MWSLLLFAATVWSFAHLPLGLSDRNTCILHQRTTFPSSQASNLLSFVAMEPHSVYHAMLMEPGHLLHSAITHSPSADAGQLKSRHPFVPATQFIGSSDNNIRAAQWADHQWNAGGRKTPQDSTFLSLTRAPNPAEWPSQEEPVSGLTASAPVSGVSDPACTNGVWPDLLFGLWVWRTRTNHGPCCPPMSHPSTSSWTARPDGSGRWDNRMAAQHLPRDLVQPSSG